MLNQYGVFNMDAFWDAIIRELDREELTFHHRDSSNSKAPPTSSIARHFMVQKTSERRCTWCNSCIDTVQTSDAITRFTAPTKGSTLQREVNRDFFLTREGLWCRKCNASRLIHKQLTWTTPVPPYVVFSIPPEIVGAPERILDLSRSKGTTESYGLLCVVVTKDRGPQQPRHAYAIGRHAAPASMYLQDVFVDAWVCLNDAADPSVHTYSEWTRRLVADPRERISVAIYARSDIASDVTAADVSLDAVLADCVQKHDEVCVYCIEVCVIDFTNLRCDFMTIERMIL
jgi:hypothetical protein